MFHIAGVRLVAPPTLLDMIADVEAVGAKIHVSAFDYRVIAVAATAVGWFPPVVPIGNPNVRRVVVGQRIHQVFWFD